MSKSAEPPKGRINIKYQPATGKHPEGVELPLKMVMIGDYTLRVDETPLEDAQVINVNKDNFEDVLKEQNIRLDLDVKDHLSGQESLPVTLTLDSIPSFEPSSIIRQVPEMSRLWDFREALSALAGPLENKKVFRTLIDKILADPELRKRLKDELGTGATTIGS